MNNFFKYHLCIGVFQLLVYHAFSQKENIALHKPAYVTSALEKFPPANMVDGKISRSSKWEAESAKPPHIIEIDLKKYYTIEEIVVHSGILDSEKKADEMNQAAGFWSIKNFKLQYWDDANWSDLPASEIHENRLVSNIFNYSPTVMTYKIRLVCDDGEPISIMEIEVFGSEAKNMPSPPSIISDTKQTDAIEGEQEINVKVRNNIVGKSMKYVGYNQGYYFPGTNVSGWIEYSNVNSLRLWASLNAFVPQHTVQVDNSLNSLKEFDSRKLQLRLNPEKNKYIKWEQLLPLYDRADSSSTNAMVFSYALKELKRLGVAIILQIGSTDFKNDWSNKWKQWQRYYALAYYSAKDGDVAMYALQNEPNHRNSGPMKLDQWIMAMQIVSDAIHSAIQDVNKKYNKKLVPKFVGPVTAGQNTDWWAAIAKAVRTDYRGKKTNEDLLQLFSTHSYNSPATGYESRVNNIRKIIQDNHPLGKSIPIVYTEIGRWMNAYLIDKEETMDTPSLFTEWGGIYSNNMKNGAYGMWAFKFANTASSTYPQGIKSGHHFTWQGKRIVEDAYHNIAFKKPVITSRSLSPAPYITDGDKSDSSTWVSDSPELEKWVIIDLQKQYDIGSAAVYTGSSYGIYTGQDRVRNFKLQYLSGSTWIDINGTIEKNNKYTQLFQIFKQPVRAQKIRFISDDQEAVKIREIKLFQKNDGPSNVPDYNVSGIQRTGEVVRLFAKGFKDERPLLQTEASKHFADVDMYTSLDNKSGNYYVWMVQRGLFSCNLNFDFKDIDVTAGVPAIAEIVNNTNYGEAKQVLALSSYKKLNFKLPPQSVVLLTIPLGRLEKKALIASANATVRGGENADKVFINEKRLRVQLDAGTPQNNAVTYSYFNFDIQKAQKAQVILLKVNGFSDKQNMPFRLHVYGIPSVQWNPATYSWNKALLLDKTEALIKSVGQKAFVAGEMAFKSDEEDHYLDVTQIVKKHAANGLSFAFVRETRQLGDDEDKGKSVFINAIETKKKPEIIYWIKK